MSTAPVLFTRSAVDSFMARFGVSRREAGRSLVRLGARTRITMRPDPEAAHSPDAVWSLKPDGADVLFVAKALPGLAALVVVRVDAQDDDEDDAEPERRAA